MARTFTLSIFLCATASLLAAGNENEIKAKSRITDVTLYRNRALITRNVDFPDKTGDMTIVVENMPETIEPNSLFAEGNGMKVNLVSFRTRNVLEKPQADTEELDQKIKEARLAVAMLENSISTSQKLENYLGNLSQYLQTTSRNDLSKGALDPKAVITVSDYIIEKTSAVSTQPTAARFQIEDLREQLRKLEFERGKNRGIYNTVREAVIYVYIPKKIGKTSLSLSYVTNGASWRPGYNIRLNEKGDKVSLEYIAHVNQSTGEDWTNVALALSTANPNMNAEFPILMPMNVSVSGTPSKGLLLGSVNQTACPQMPREDASGRKMSLASWQTPQNAQQQVDNILTLNSDAYRQQKQELYAGQQKIPGGSPSDQSGLAVEYDITGKLTLTNRNETQIVQIALRDLAAKSFYEAIPLLSHYVYRGVSLENTTDYTLLAGPYSAYVAGDFVGGGNLPVTAVGQYLTIGMGVDPQLQCSRELLKRTDETSWGSKIIKFNYRLCIDSYKKHPVTVRLYDRMPVTKNENLSISIIKGAERICSDEDYLADEYKRGILRWDVTVPGNANGSKAAALDYSYMLKFPKDLNLNMNDMISPVTVEKLYNKRIKSAK